VLISPRILKNTMHKTKFIAPALAIATLALCGFLVPRATAGPSCDTVIRKCLKETTAISEAADRVRDTNPAAAAQLDELLLLKQLQCQAELVEACPFSPLP